MKVTLGQMVRFVLDNRKGNAFRDYPEEVIASSISRAADDQTLLYACNQNGEIVGVVTAFCDEKNKKMHVHDILTKERWVLKAFVAEFKARWPEYTLTANRCGRFVTYQTEKLCSKLLTLKGVAI